MLREKLITQIDRIEALDGLWIDRLKTIPDYQRLTFLPRYFLYLAVTRNHSASFAVSRPPDDAFHINWKLYVPIIGVVILIFFIPKVWSLWNYLNSPLEFATGKTIIEFSWDAVWQWVRADTISFKEIVPVGGAAFGLYLLNTRTKAVDKQAQLAEDGLDLDRFRKGSEMLTHKHTSVRQAGIDGLMSLALSRPKEYGSLVLDIFTSFVKKPDVTSVTPSFVKITGAISTNYEVYKIKDRPDVHLAFTAAMQIWQHKLIRKRYLRKNGYLNMDGVRLEGGYYRALDFQWVRFDKAEFVNSFFIDTKFGFARFYRADFKYCTFTEASFVGTWMFKTKFFSCDLEDVNWNGAALNQVEINEQLDPSSVDEAYRVAWLSEMQSVFGKVWFRSDMGSVLLLMSSATSLGCRIIEEKCGSLMRIKFVKDASSKE